MGMKKRTVGSIHCSVSSCDYNAYHTVVGEIEGSLRLKLKLSGKWEAIKHFGGAGRNVIAAVLGQEESGHSMFHGRNRERRLTEIS